MALVQFREFIIYKVNIREKLFAVCYNFTTFVKNSGHHYNYHNTQSFDCEVVMVVHTVIITGS